MPDSPILRISSRIRVTGPLTDGRAARIMDDFANDLEEHGAEWAERSIKRTYHASFKHPTGYYESNIRIENVGGHPEVTDGGFAGPVYGPWLEGVGSRNNTTRFKGYHAFRKAAMRLERRFEEMGEQLFDRSYRHRF